MFLIEELVGWELCESEVHLDLETAEMEEKNVSKYVNCAIIFISMSTRYFDEINVDGSLEYF